MQQRPTRRDRTYAERVDWSHPCFAEAKKKVHRIQSYRVLGIAHFVSQIGITAGLKNGNILLGCAISDHHFSSFINSVKGCVIDMTSLPNYDMILDELQSIVSNFPQSMWKRVAKLSLAYTESGSIEFISSSHESLANWLIGNAKYGNMSKNSKQRNEIKSLVENFESQITKSISNFVHKTDLHIVRLQPGALRSVPGVTGPQRAHRDLYMKTYKQQFPGQIFIGFMPLTEDGMFLQVWNGPGVAKLVFIPYGNFLLLPANTINAGWMCTSLSHYNHRLHFYILVSKKANVLARNEKLFLKT
jgi:hypothetical protein